MREDIGRQDSQAWTAQRWERGWGWNNPRSVGLLRGEKS